MKIQEGSLTCAAELLPLFCSAGSNAPNLNAHVTNIEGFNCAISADFPPPPDALHVSVFLLSASFKNNIFYSCVRMALQLKRPFGLSCSARQMTN